MNESASEYKNNIEQPKSLFVYVVRHGKTDYIERGHVQETGKWNDELDDLTPEGKEGLLKTALRIREDLDPTKHIIIFLSSPRARALRSMDQIADYLKQEGFEIGQQNTVESLRSGGDKAPLVGKNKELVFPENTTSEGYDISTEDGMESTGVRFRQILSYFSSVDKELLWKKIKSPEENSFHGKIPVFITVTHGEVMHAGNYTDEEYGKSFIGNLYKGHNERVKLKRGKLLKLEFDLEHPGQAKAYIRRAMSPKGEKEVIDFSINQNNGSVERLKK